MKLIALVLSTCLCGLAGSGPAKPGAAPVKSDAELEKAIRTKFSASKISEDRFTVRVAGGVATIEGQTNVIQRKGVATRLAKNAGARKVVNNIKIGDAARQRAAQNLSKAIPRRVAVKPAPAPQ